MPTAVVFEAFVNVCASVPISFEAVRARALERPWQIHANGVALTRPTLLALVDVLTCWTFGVVFVETESVVTGAREGAEGVGTVAVGTAGVIQALV